MLFVARLIDGISGANISVRRRLTLPISRLPENRAKGHGASWSGLRTGICVWSCRLADGRVSPSIMPRPMFIAAGLALRELLFVMFFLPESTNRKREAKRSEPFFLHLLDHVERRTYAWSRGELFSRHRRLLDDDGDFAPPALRIVSVLMRCTQDTFSPGHWHSWRDHSGG